MLVKAVQTEVNALPRGVGRRNAMNPTQSMTSALPDVLRRLYESSTSPGILPGVAGTYFLFSLFLFCFLITRA